MYVGVGKGDCCSAHAGKTMNDKVVDKLQTSYRENKQISGPNNLWVAITKIKVE